MSGSKLSEDSSPRAVPEAASAASDVTPDQPLGLTVHSLPQPEQVMDVEQVAQMGDKVIESVNGIGWFVGITIARQVINDDAIAGVGLSP